VGLVQHAPLFVGQVDGVLQALEDQVAGFGAVPLGPQRREGEGVGSVVGKVEAALEAELGPLGVGEASAAGTQQTYEFGFGRRLRLEPAYSNQVVELALSHRRYP